MTLIPSCGAAGGYQTGATSGATAPLPNGEAGGDPLEPVILRLLEEWPLIKGAARDGDPAR
jgi:hypothetical protein